MSTPLWARYRKKYSHGPSSWKYFYYQPDPDMTLEEMIEASFIHWDEGEHYRGFDCEIIDKPPLEFIQDEIENSERRIRNANKYLEILRNVYPEQNNSEQ